MIKRLGGQNVRPPELLDAPGVDSQGWKDARVHFYLTPSLSLHGTEFLAHDRFP